MADKQPEAARLEKGDRVLFHFAESPQYRTIHCDGAVGGLTPRGYISCTIYNERNMIPSRVSREVLEVSEEGGVRLGDEQSEGGSVELMRQLEATILFDLNSAREFLSWFREKVADLEKSAGVPDEQRVTKG